MAAPVSSSDRLESVTPHPLFEIPDAVLQQFGGASPNARWGDVTPDGQRILMVKGPEGPGPQLVVAPGFLDEARAKLRAAGWTGPGGR